MKIYALAWVVVLAATLVFVLLKMTVAPSHHGLAKNPYDVEKIIGVELPDIACVESDDNMDRTTSCWDCYTHYVQFSEPLSAESISKLNALCESDPVHWSARAGEDYYLYIDDGELYSISCYIYDDHAYVDYVVEETEGVFAIIPFLLAYEALIVWGVVLVVVWLVRKIKR